MNAEDRRYLAAAADAIDRLLKARPAQPLHPTELSAELQTFAERFDQLLNSLAAWQQFAAALGSGNLRQEPPPREHLLDPLKQLHSNLRHLTWQTQRVAAGDLEQRVDFLGDFSRAFNQMIDALREKRVVEDKVRYLSEHDALTGLYNRTLFESELARLRSTPHDYPVSVVIADVDGLKSINDTLGHQVGDLLIQKSAQIIQHGPDGDGLLARIGGDEFAILSRRTDEAHTAALVERIRSAMGNFNRREAMFNLSISLGTGLASAPSALDAALHQADKAMYEDKLRRKRLGRHTATDR